MRGRRVTIGCLVILLVLVGMAIVVSIVGAAFFSRTASVRSSAIERAAEAVPQSETLLSLVESTQVVDEKVPASAGATVQVESQLGNVQVTGTDVSEVSVHATKVGKGLSQEAADEELSNLQLQVTGSGDQITVTAGRTAGAPPSAVSRIDLEVTVPTGATVNAKAALGQVKISGIQSNVTVDAALGKVDLSDIQGDITVTANMGNVSITNSTIAQNLNITNKMGNTTFQGRLPASGEGNLIADMGNVTVSLPPDSGFRLEAEAGMGKILSDFQGDASSRGTGSTLTATVGDGKFLLKIRDNVGRVEIKKGR